MYLHIHVYVLMYTHHVSNAHHSEQMTLVEPHSHCLEWWIITDTEVVGALQSQTCKELRPWILQELSPNRVEGVWQTSWHQIVQGFSASERPGDEAKGSYTHTAIMQDTRVPIARTSCFYAGQKLFSKACVCVFASPRDLHTQHTHTHTHTHLTSWKVIGLLQLLPNRVPTCGDYYCSQAFFPLVPMNFDLWTPEK